MAEYNRIISFKEPIYDKVLPGYVIRTEKVKNEGSCRVKCYLDPNCVSINVGPEVEGTRTCELKNFTDESSAQSDLEERKDHLHFAIEINKKTPEGVYSGCVGVTKNYPENFRKPFGLPNILAGTPGPTIFFFFFFFFFYNFSVFRNCAELYEAGFQVSGVYSIDPDNTGAFKVYCDQTTDGGGWTVFQKRLDGSVDFFRGWDDYKRGFGDLNGEFWLGLDKIHHLTKNHSRLRVDLADFDEETAYAMYDSFGVANEQQKYRLQLGQYTGTAGDSLNIHRNMKFSTKDQKNNNHRNDCANKFEGAWWYGNSDCHHSNLNGRYLKGPHPTLGNGVNWRD
ncbi:unnamed protein product [Porites evermanni]|uniref:Fibrinogen C-terminal domain-containing protein n=1 Tax=Porites evermanni TaxID=104178 RepID=A0ABN8SWV4_9CNID|nr:unnamed protein product [Porites evermanni]